MRSKLILVPSLWLASLTNAYAQQLPEHAGRSLNETYLSLGVLLFGLVIIVGQIVVMLKKQHGWGPYSTRMVGLTLVIIAGVFLITAGYSQNQIAPMIGLLGTIAGYLLGKTSG